MSKSEQPSLVQAKFHMHPTFGPVVTLKIGIEANAPDVTERVTAQHIEDYPKEWFRFQNSRASVRPIGTPLGRGLGMDEELVSLFIAHGVMDVETFATLPDARIQQIMPGNWILGIDHRDRAARMVPEAQRTPLVAATRDPTPAETAAARAVAAVTPPGVAPAPRGEPTEADLLRAQIATLQQERDTAVRAYAAASQPAQTAMDTADEPEDVAGESQAEAALGGEVRRGPGRPRRAA